LTARTADGAAETEAVAALRDGAIVLANAPFVQLWGGKAWQEAIRDVERRARLLPATAPADLDIELRLDDGRTVRRRVRVEPLHGMMGEGAVLVSIGGSAAAGSDPQELRRRAGALAHDLNNAIGSVLLNAQLALEGLEQAAPGRAEVEEMRKAGESAAALTRRLQALSRGEGA
jgi:signal transduction histidine kinase